MSTDLMQLRELERLVSNPLDPEYEAWRACRYRFVLDRGVVRRQPTVGGGSGLTGTQTELIYASPSPGTAKNTWTTEAGPINDTAGMGTQAVIPPYFWLPGAGSVAKVLRFMVRGIVSSTVTPSFTWFCRFVSTAGPLVAGTGALPTTSGAASQVWEMQWDSVMRTMGAAGGNNSTIASLGLLSSPGLNPAVGQLFGGAASPGTVLVDVGATNLVFIDAACTASSASNGLTVLHLLIQGLN